MDKRLEPIKDLEFNFNEEMKELIFDMLAIRQMLNNEELSKRERKQLEKFKMQLVDKFRDELQSLNPTQIAIVRAFLYGKKMMRDKQIKTYLSFLIYNDYGFYNFVMVFHID